MEIRIYGSDSPLSGGTKYISNLSGSSAYFDGLDVTGTTTTNILDATTASATTFYGGGQFLTNLDQNTSISGSFVNTSGDTMTGDLIISGGNLTASTISATTYLNFPSDAVTGATNIGGGTEIYSGINNKTLEFRTLSGTSEQKVTAYTQNNNIILDVILAVSCSRKSTY
jgi:hypothetical protein